MPDKYNKNHSKRLAQDLSFENKGNIFFVVRKDYDARYMVVGESNFDKSNSVIEFRYLNGVLI